MANWRARVRIPQKVDEWLRDYSASQHIKLKDFLGNVIVSGVRSMSSLGTRYDFVQTKPIYAVDVVEIEYLIDDSLKDEVMSQCHLIKRGKGKLQKILLELFLIAYEARPSAASPTALPSAPPQPPAP